MIFTVQRLWATEKSTCGEGRTDDGWQCFTLELPLGDGLPGSAIPAGTYPVILYPSQRFKRIMPMVMGVPNRSEIEIHWGNFPDNTNGCILVGKTHGPDFVGSSREAFEELFLKIEAGVAQNDCWIAVHDAAVPMGVEESTG